MDNENGRKIAHEMLPWLDAVYDVHPVYHDGSKFELPAMEEAKRLSKLYHLPVLYIHTRGAVNVWRTTIPTRRMWMEEFGEQWRKYFAICETEKPRVACPFCDSDGETRYNGFVANTAAWEMVSLAPSADRMVYESLWKGKDVVVGTIIHSIDNDIHKIRKYLYRNYL